MSPNLTLDIRHRALRGGRLHISAQTASRRVRKLYQADVRTLIDRGQLDVVERLRRGKVTLAEIRAAVIDDDLSRLKSDDIADRDPLPLEEATARVLRVVTAQGVEGTSKEYRTVARLLERHFGAARNLATITTDEARRFLQQPQESNRGEVWAPGRQTVVRALLQRMWDDEIRRERERAAQNGEPPRLTENPWKGLKLPRVRQTRHAFLTIPEWRRLAKRVQGKPQHAFLALAYLAGLRLGEATHLRTGVDVDIDERVIRVQSREGKHAWRPKSERGERRVPMGAELADVLSAHMERGYAGKRYLITLPGRDRPISPPTAQKWTRQSYSVAGIKYGREGDGLTYHSGRHTFASWLVQKDVSPLKVAELIGDTPEMVFRVYGHLGPRDLERTIGILDEMLAEVGMSQCG